MDVLAQKRHEIASRRSACARRSGAWKRCQAWVVALQIGESAPGSRARGSRSRCPPTRAAPRARSRSSRPSPIRARRAPRARAPTRRPSRSLVRPSNRMLVERHRAHAQLGGELAHRNRADPRAPGARRERGEDPLAHRIRVRARLPAGGLTSRPVLPIDSPPNASNRKILSLLVRTSKGKSHAGSARSLASCPAGARAALGVAPAAGA